MNRKKAFYLDIASPKVERLKLYYDSFSKAIHYRKQISKKKYIHYRDGCSLDIKPWPLHFQDGLEFKYIRHGSGSYYIDGKIYQFKQRQLLIIKPNEIHGGCRLPVNEAMDDVLLMFPPDWIAIDLRIGSLPHELILTEEEAAKLEMICRQIKNEITQKAFGYEEMIRTKIQEFSCWVLRLARRPASKKAMSLVVAQLKDYVDRHFAEELSVAGVGKRFGYSREHLTRQFKDSMGMTLKHYILQRRVMEACSLLEANPELKLAAIAERIGFNSYCLFHRAFRKIFGIAPEMYKGLLAKRPLSNYQVSRD